MARHTLRHSKKAQIGDMIFVLVTIASVALTMLVGAFLYYEIKPGLNDNDFASNESIKAYNDFGVAFPMLDMSFLLIVIALIIGLLVSAMFIPTSPIFVVVNIVGLLALIFLGGIFANLYGTMLEQEGANTTMQIVATQNYPITTFIVSNLPYIGAVLVLLASIIMYSKANQL